MKCEHIRLAHCVAKTGQVWILCNSIDQYIGPLRLVNHTRHYSVSHAWKIWSHIWSRGGCTSTLKLPWPLYGQHCWCAISIRMASVLTLLTKLIYWCFSLFFVFTGTLRWFNIWGTCVCECRPMATCKIFATASDFHLQIHGQSTYNLRMPPRKLDWIFASRVGQSQVAVEASLVIFHLSTHLWHIPHASSQVWRHSRRSVVSDRHGHSHDFQGMKLSLRHSLRNTLQTDNFYFFQDCNGSHEIKYKKINVSHIPRSSRTLTSLNNTCPCTCVSERKKKLCVCACVYVCSVNFVELRGLSWGVLFSDICLCACSSMCSDSLPAWVPSTSFSWSWWKVNSTLLFFLTLHVKATYSKSLEVCVLYAVLLLFFLFSLTPQHRSHSAWIHLACNLYAYPGWKNQEFTLAHVELQPCFLAYLAFQQRIMTVSI